MKETKKMREQAFGEAMENFLNTSNVEVIESITRKTQELINDTLSKKIYYFLTPFEKKMVDAKLPLWIKRIMFKITGLDIIFETMSGTGDTNMIIKRYGDTKLTVKCILKKD